MLLEDHSPRDVACLIYESAPELFTLMFGSRSIPSLARLVQRSHNRFSRQYIRVAEIDHRPVGIVTFVPAAYINAAADYLDILNPVQRFWLKLIQRLLLQHVLQYVYPAGSFYIGNLAIDSYKH
jgi:hypothetical protein